MIKVEMLAGYIILPRPTGRWEKDDDGFWREVYTPKKTITPNGVSEEPFKGLVGFSENPTRTLATKAA